MRNIPKDFPDVLRIEPAGECNFKCSHCAIGVGPNDRALLSRTGFASITDQLMYKNFVPRVVVLYHGGEPLLNKDIAYYVKELKNMGVKKTVITTNGSLLSAERSEELIMAGLDEIKISYDGESADENNTIRKNGDFFRDANNVRTLLNLRRRLNRGNPKVTIVNVRVCDKDAIGMFMPKNGRRRTAFGGPPSYLTEYFKNESRDIEFKSFPAMIWPGYEGSGEFDLARCPAEGPKYCWPLFETITILSNGDVVPCCNDLKGDLVLGNIFRTDIFDIWMNDRYVKLRQDFKARRYDPLCERCDMVSPCFLCKKAG